jgi:hypothetical protein
MLNIIINYANANQNNVECISSGSDWLSRKQIITSANENGCVWGGRNPYTLLGGV